MSQNAEKSHLPNIQTLHTPYIKYSLHLILRYTTRVIFEIRVGEGIILGGGDYPKKATPRAAQGA